MRLSSLHIILLGLIASLALLAGCGGGGGGGGGGNTGTPTTVTGRILHAETGLPPSPPPTIMIGSVTTTANADGTFSFTPAANATTATVTSTGSKPRMFTVALTAGKTKNLGDIYISDTGYTATVTGRVVTVANNQTQPVGNAVVTIGNVSATTKTDGTFTLTGLPEGLGNVAGTFGKISATGFEDKPINDQNLQFPLAAGSNPLGDLVIQVPSGAVPLPPYTINGVVQVGGKAQSGVPVTLSTPAGAVGTVMTDSTGTYTFWVVPGTYTVTATNGSATKMTTVTLTSLATPVTAPMLSF